MEGTFDPESAVGVRVEGACADAARDLSIRSVTGRVGEIGLHDSLRPLCLVSCFMFRVSKVMVVLRIKMRRTGLVKSMVGWIYVLPEFAATQS